MIQEEACPWTYAKDDAKEFNDSVLAGGLSFKKAESYY